MAIPSWATAEVRNWRTFAKLPDEITDEAIFAIVQKESLHYSTANSDEENQAEVDFLRQELGL